jgi:hypothetical protein
MVMQTVALVSFAIGHRGLGTHLPSTAAIDPHTGFCRINEKYEADRSEFRMVWVDPTARKQISEYEHHLRVLERHGPTLDFELIQQDVAEGRLPIFELGSEGARYCKIADVWTMLRERAPDLECMRLNSGRHWLRSNLDGKCSTETLHAMFGHWHIGTEPWSYGSCLDPLLYRADLERSIPACLEKVGWQALPSPLVNDRG